MLLIPNALCWSSRKCNCACALPAEVQLRLRVTRRSWQKLFAGKNFIKILVTAQTQLRSYSEQQRAFGNSNICNWLTQIFSNYRSPNGVAATDILIVSKIFIPFWKWMWRQSASLSEAQYFDHIHYIQVSIFRQTENSAYFNPAWWPFHTSKTQVADRLFCAIFEALAKYRLYW